MAQKKIAIVIYRLSKGGAERAASTLSVFLAEKGHDVHNIIVLDDVSYPFGGRLKNLGKLKNNSNDPVNKLKRLRALRTYLKKEEFDVLIDFRFRTKPLQEFLLSHYVYNCPAIYTIHSSDLSSYMPKSRFLTRLIYKKAFCTVAVSEAMRQLVSDKYQLEPLRLIYNSIDEKQIRSLRLKNIDMDYRFVIAVGQFDTNVKQFDHLIRSYAESQLPKEEVHLVILGEGGLRQKLEALSESLDQRNKVHLPGFVTNPYPYLKEAEFLILTSAFEGMPMVLIEALACGTPVVSYNCKTGPNEIIDHEVNGLLVNDQDQEDLVQQINRFVTDKKLYLSCASQAEKSVAKFQLESVGNKWLNLLDEI